MGTNKVPDIQCTLYSFLCAKMKKYCYNFAMTEHVSEKILINSTELKVR